MAAEEKAARAMPEESHGTIFDDVFKTIVEKFPWLLVPMINEVFGTDYGEHELVEEEKTEYQTPEGRRMMDSHIRIRDKVYHVECQSNEDSFMVIRMVEYDFHEALGRARQELWKALRQDGIGRVTLDFPSSCVLYLRHSRNTPDQVEMDIRIPGNEPVKYAVPIIKTQTYSKDEIFQKKLLMLLPFYILRYEKCIKSGQSDFLDAWTEEYEDILNRLRNIREDDRGGVYEQLVELVRKLAGHVGEKNEKFMERVENVMGGQVLELETGKAWEQGRRQGVEQGRRQGVEQGRRQGVEQGEDRINRLIQCLSDSGRTDDLLRSTRDRNFQQKLLKEYGL